jgi:FkbM family methyltransferase
MSIRTLAERLSRGVVLRRRMPERFRHLPIYVTPEAGLRYWGAMSKVDPLLFDMAEEIVKPGSVVWDVGANVGLFSACAAVLAGGAGEVLSIEPDVWLASLIIRTSRLLVTEKYDCARIVVLSAAISDKNGISKLAIAQRARASNYLADAGGSVEARGIRHLQSTAVLTLDCLLEECNPPSVLKIDAETHELHILRGARRLLQDIRPVIWCEVSAANSAEVANLLHEAGYRLYGAQQRPHPIIERAWFHTLALPI